jgi:hypothetical protein
LKPEGPALPGQGLVGALVLSHGKFFKKFSEIKIEPERFFCEPDANPVSSPIPGSVKTQDISCVYRYLFARRGSFA